METKGTIIEIFDTVEISERFRKREFVIEAGDNPQYPEFVKFELIQDRCELLNAFSVGDTIEVHFNLKGRKWTDRQGEIKYFNSLQAWRLKNDGGDGEGSSTASASTAPEEKPGWLDDSQDDDMPF